MRSLPTSLTASSTPNVSELVPPPSLVNSYLDTFSAAMRIVSNPCLSPERRLAAFHRLLSYWAQEHGNIVAQLFEASYRDRPL